MMKIAVIGATGQLGSDICETFTLAGHEIVPLAHTDIEVGDPESVASVISGIRPAAIINTAAAHNVERCEAAPTEAFAVNALGARNLARASENIGAYFLHISTDYVFDGAKKRPYIEADAALPLNVYGNSKLSGESFALTLCKSSAVIRVSGIYGVNPCRAKGGMNFVSLMLKLGAERPEVRVVNDEFLTPTYTVDIARQALSIVEARACGLYHATAHGECSWYEFAKEIFSLSGVHANLQPARPGEFPAKVPRPSYSVLDNLALRTQGLDNMSAWQDGLARFLRACRSSK